GRWWSVDFEIDGRAKEPGRALPQAVGRIVMPGYFDALGIPLLRGRPILETDDATSAPSAVIDRLAAERYWPGRNPIGERIRFDEPHARWFTIVGVVDAVHYDGMEQDPKPMVYLSMPQAAFGFFGDW